MPKKIRDYLMKMRRCHRGKHPRTPSFALYSAKNHAATLEDVDRFLFENFKSLCLKEEEEETQKEEETSTVFSFSESSTMMNTNTSDDVSSSNYYHKDPALPDNSIALLVHSTSPYQDFTRSMQQMVNNHQSLVDWNFMEDLLFTYLNLNPKTSHKFILTAFVDLVNLMRRQPPSPSPSPSHIPRSVRTVRTAQSYGIRPPKT
ncbi:hypothetical protein VNO78_14466 [Psophocarpus tetragonolobus]|uniref:Transcription repressor n=1 Tax=Psophocarpus tetragonolobus TaxID=3891 RepID=A0AAN9SQ75_PSOTE